MLRHDSLLANIELYTFSTKIQYKIICKDMGKETILYSLYSRSSEKYQLLFIEPLLRHSQFQHISLFYLIIRNLIMTTYQIRLSQIRKYTQRAFPRTL